MAPGKELIATLESDYGSEKFVTLRDIEKLMPLGYEVCFNKLLYVNTKTN